MAGSEFSVNQQRRVPVKRNGLFYDREQFGFDMEMGREYVEGDLSMTVVLYSVNLSKTNQDELYGETRTDGVVYYPPVEVPCVYTIEDADLRAYEKSKNLGVYQKQGKLKMSVYVQTLEELAVDIKNGDYIGVQVTEKNMEFFQVDNDGKNNYGNEQLLFGTVPVVRNLTASSVDKSIFNG